MGCDNFIGKYAPKIKAQYYEYNDCVKLCKRCHKHVHRLYIRHIRNWFKADIINETTALALRTKLIKLCKSWLKRKKRARI